MSYRGTGHANVDPNRPDAQAVCDRCGFWYNLKTLQWQYDWRGNQLTNLRVLVCPPCYDEPQPQLRPVIIPPDPIPLPDARPEPFDEDYADP